MGNFNDVHYVDAFSRWGWLVMAIACLMAGWIACYSILVVKRNNREQTLFRCDHCAAGMTAKATVFIYVYTAGKIRAITLCRECFDSQPCAAWQPDVAASK